MGSVPPIRVAAVRRPVPGPAVRLHGRTPAEIVAAPPGHRRVVQRTRPGHCPIGAVGVGREPPPQRRPARLRRDRRARPLQRLGVGAARGDDDDDCMADGQVQGRRRPCHLGQGPSPDPPGSHDRRREVEAPAIRVLRRPGAPDAGRRGAGAAQCSTPGELDPHTQPV